MLSAPAPVPVCARQLSCAELVSKPLDQFEARHVGCTTPETTRPMVAAIAKAHNIDISTVQDLIDATVPKQIRLKEELKVGEPMSESEALKKLKDIMSKNTPMKSFIGQGFYNSKMPSVILRNVLENPAWYTPYTPYQAEVSQGRLEAMLNFQTMLHDLTGFAVPTCSLLDEATAAAESMSMCFHISKEKKKTFFVDKDVHPHVLGVIKTRAEPIGVKVVVGDWKTFNFNQDICGAIVQYPNTFGGVEDYSSLASRVHQVGGKVVASVDLLALTIFKAPSEWGADIAIGSSNRFGLPPANGGPHAGFLATTDELKRSMPGRIIGVSKDVAGNPALRMALQTREQHIKREKATSNICTASALMCDISGFYAAYHGPEGLKNIANSIRCKTILLNKALRALGYSIEQHGEIFDTVHAKIGHKGRSTGILLRARNSGINLRDMGEDIAVTFDETTTIEDIEKITEAFAEGRKLPFSLKEMSKELECPCNIPSSLKRTSGFLEHPNFHKYQTEHEMMRYLYGLQLKDVGLSQHMIPLGSCTMKLNAASEMIPMTWPEFTNLHPFAPLDQKKGSLEMIAQLEKDLANITGFSACSLQPNSGAAGEYAGLLTIRNYLKSTGQGHRNICLLPQSAHGTNPASAAMAGMSVVTVSCDAKGNIDVNDLKEKAKKYKDKLACLMVTYPSTYGIYEETILDIIRTIHENGGQVYMDGANMNAQVGLTAPGFMGADVCHLNLHKTFAIPHGGGGPGIGPICAAKHLAPFLPSHSVVGIDGRKAGAVASGPWGSAMALPISWMYIKMLGSKGLKAATSGAVLNANYMAARLKDYYNIVYTGPNGTVAHEFILDCRPFKSTSGIESQDIAKRLIDFGFHAPTMSFPVANTLMIEPTESESIAELDKLCDALIQIRQEIRDIEEGRMPRDDNPLVNAPHTAEEVVSSTWSHPYSREVAAYPLAWVKRNKYWATVKRVDNTYGDLHLAPTLGNYAKYDE
eukprot:TRINITY_DN22740_c0_g1_i1.p1 TRINITY_DN22740_c0_g1~~TRINITY_DN22740_c0_g1_i1.p1  ORF type:complete len:983 (-),score=279.69 TRINITY_DN22740_c0_g1_i1:49-2997(-)